ncbi:class I SAM-dependent methyltransferase [Methanoplanus limicola]|uniref:Methyltransferase type 11 n=1 Tax=Methanoplanus limicola DSM 2279 TaxID=937775 RepID=H1Z0M0_9EURY|nr:class I SAM-dependent methyltransferase [Methanoplanus limicola]EHQ35277.1 Methyltransferase type 11 [Methanoplanus limicola DSM 2279]
MRTIQKNTNPPEKLCRYSFTHTFMLDNRIRKFFQNPKKILSEYITQGMTIIDLGCGPGTFTCAMAELAGGKGTVIGCDLQYEMLRYAEKRCRRTGPESRIIWHRSSPERTGIEKKADFILSFYMVHEVSDRNSFLVEVYDMLKPKGKYLIAEPKFHVTETAFQKTIESAEDAGFTAEEYPQISMSRAVILSKRDNKMKIPDENP